MVLNNNVYAGAAYGPTLPTGWSLAGVADFNRNGKMTMPSSMQDATNGDLLFVGGGICQQRLWTDDSERL